MNKCKLGDISQLKTGPFGTQLKASEYTLEGTPIINVKNIGYGNLILNNLDYVPESVCHRLSEHLLTEGDIVFGRKGSVDRHCLIKEQHAGWMQGSDCIRVRLNEGINPQYISYYLMLNHVKKQINDSAVGSTMASLNTDVLKSITIHLPDLTIQNKIAHLLSVFDQRISVNQLLVEKLETMSKTLYDFWFTQFDFPDENGNPYKSSGGKMLWNKQLNREIPDGWNVNEISSFCSIISGYPFDSCSYSDYGLYKLITIKNVQDGYIKSETDNNISDLPINLPDYALLKKGDILMSLTGNVGRVGIIYEENCLLNQRVAILNPTGADWKGLIYFMFRNPTMTLQMQSLASGTSQKNLSPIEAGEIKLPVNKEVFTLFTQRVNPIYQKIISCYEENVELTKLRDWLLPLLMNGQIIIT